jgi:hypothetical protein
MRTILPAPGRYVYGRVDLNGDGRDEVMAYLMGSFFCGTGGCTLQLFTESQDGYAPVTQFPLSRTPVIVAATKTAGWNDLFRIESERRRRTSSTCSTGRSTSSANGCLPTPHRTESVASRAM